MRVLLAVAAALLALPASASAREPIMPLEEVRAGMACTGYSVVRGTTISAFDIEVLDVVDGDPALGAPRILFRASGPAVDETGLGPGFSGSPILCPDAQGTRRNVGAISESIGEYGGKVALATPIEAILGAGPLTVTGLSAPVARVLAQAGRRVGRPVLAAPAGPLRSFAPQPLVPGAAMAVAYATGDIRLGAIGTVTYRDGDRVWGFGHPLDGAGRRALLLQDAYVFRVVNNPIAAPDLGTYKLAAPGHDLGTLSNDALSAVVGRVGPLPSTVPVRARVTDEDTGTTRTTALRVADEVAVGHPNLPFIAPLAILQGTVNALHALPPNLSGTLCARITLRERRAPLGYCNRYASPSGGFEGEGDGNGVLAAAYDLLGALDLVDRFDRRALHVRRVEAHLRLRRQGTLLLRAASLPRRVRPGQRVQVRLRVQRPRAEHRTISVPWRVPRGLRRGARTLTVRGLLPQEDRDLVGRMSEELGPESAGGHGGPRTLRELARGVRSFGAWDGLVVRFGDERRRLYRDPAFRITGRATMRVRVVAPRRPGRRPGA